MAIEVLRGLLIAARAKLVAALDALDAPGAERAPEPDDSAAPGARVIRSAGGEVTRPGGARPASRRSDSSGA
jgi:hypothetical protein